MENIIILNDTSYLKDKVIGYGYNGTCYLTKDNKIYKEFRRYNDHSNIDKDLINYNVSSFAMPKTLVFNKYNEYIGYIRRYIEGIILSEINNKVLINDFILALEQFEEDLIYLSYEGLILYDLNPDNILYTKDNKLVAIDSDLYSFLFGHTYLNSKENLKSLNDSIIKTILYNSIYLNKQIDNIKNRYNGNIKPSELLNYLLNEINKNSNENIDTIGDYQRSLRYLYRR